MLICVCFGFLQKLLYQSAKKLYNTCGVARTFGNTQEVVLARKILFGNYKNKALYIAYVAVLCALTVVCQYFLAQTGNQLLVGSVVNMFLLFATTLCGIVGGATLGCVTPFVAFLLGISKNFAQTPFVEVGGGDFSHCGGAWGGGPGVVGGECGW